MQARYDLLLVTLSVIVAIGAGYIALDLAGRVAVAHGRIRLAWLWWGALAMGLCIWSMHFIGMLAFRLSAGVGSAHVPMMYDVPHLVLSVVVAVGASMVALIVVGRERPSRLAVGLGILVFGVGLVAMHGTGMAGLHVSAPMSVDQTRVFLASLVAMAASVATLMFALRLRADVTAKGLAQRVGGAVVIGVGLAAMHYTAMSAASFGSPDPTLVIDEDAVLATSGLGWAVWGTTLVVLILAMIGTAVDRAIRARMAMAGEIERLYAESEAVNVRLQRAVVDAEQANQAKSAFLATMSHELRTPLNAFSGYLQLMQMGIAGPVTEAQQQYLERLQASSRHLTGLINDVLDLAKIESGQLVVRRGDVHVSAVVEDAISLMRPQIESRGLHLGQQCDLDPGARFMGDEDRVRQILVNLISNAVKYNTAGGRIDIDCGATDVPDEEARLRGESHWAFVRVRDTGIGIPRDKLELIFEPFTQVDPSHARKVGGTGLGLTISRRLARQMEGDLTVRSTIDAGSVFTLWLPATSQGEPDASPTVLEENRRRAVETGMAPPIRGLAAVGSALQADTSAILESFTARLRRDPQVPGAARLKYSQIADHYAALLVDIAATLIVLEEAGGGPTPMLLDSTDIQRFIAELHGVQRAQLGWSEQEMRREHALLREDVTRGERRPPPGQHEAYEAAHRVVMRFLEQAEENSVKALLGLHERETSATQRTAS